MDKIKKNKKVVIKSIVVGIILFVASIAMVIVGVDQYTSAKEQYKIDRDEWFYGDGQMPSYPNLPFITFMGFASFFISIPCLVYGLAPSVIKKTKTNLKAMGEETGNMLEFFTQKQTRTCAYCGSALEDGKTKCDNCGASVNK